MNNFDGITISEKNFMKLSAAERDRVIFKNTEELKDLIYRYKFHQKIQYGTIGVLIAIILWMVNHVSFK